MKNEQRAANRIPRDANAKDEEQLTFTPRKTRKPRPGEITKGSLKKAFSTQVASRSKFLKMCENFKVEQVRDIQRFLLGMAPKALALKDAILTSPKASVWLRNTVGTEVLDRLAPKPTQNISVKGAIVTAQYSDTELRQMLMNRILNAAEQEVKEESDGTEDGR